MPFDPAPERAPDLGLVEDAMEVAVPVGATPHRVGLDAILTVSAVAAEVSTPRPARD
uniref:Putative erythromycin esterse n=1 Tax=Actinopolyspora erythraea TaxID=414996 RepID=A0A096ZP65_9ACTN|nr:putative erythromycin esterse [Actinopolyspora erythraea]